jgi:hypothetical protein
MKAKNKANLELESRSLALTTLVTRRLLDSSENLRQDVNSNVARKDCSHRLPDIPTLNAVERQLDRVSSIIFSELDPLGSSLDSRRSRMNILLYHSSRRFLSIRYGILPSTGRCDGTS